MTIQPQGGVPCSKTYKFNKFLNFDGTSHGTFVLSHGTIDSVTGQHSHFSIFVQFIIADFEKQTNNNKKQKQNNNNKKNTM